MSEFAEYTDRLNLREQIARIDLALAAAHRQRQEVQLAPWALALGGVTSGAALFAAAAAFTKLFL